MKLSPFIHHILLGFGIFNLIFGVTLFFFHPKIDFIVISSSIPQEIWGGIFVLIALATFFGLINNFPKLLRYCMIIGLLIKVLWLFGFIFRTHHGGTIVSVELWGFIAYIQALGVVYFMPEDRHGSA